MEMEIKVVGSGCANCKKLLASVKEVVADLGVQADVLYVTELADILATGIMRTPGLMIDGKVKSMGRVPSVKEIGQMISDAK